MLQTIVSNSRDRDCLFWFLSYLMYDTQLIMAREVNELIMRHVRDNWKEFSIMFHDSKEDNYTRNLGPNSTLPRLSSL